ncbi:MAG: outer membrane beta-barrel protein [Acidobacteriota bacterium]|nr:outer membrane beta-barrel protein [Acidobacteriota bacterium]
MRTAAAIVGVLLAGALIGPAMAQNANGTDRWSGWYLGFGTSRTSGQWTVDGASDNVELQHEANNDSGTWNASLGYNHRLGDRLLVGIEASFTSTDLEGTVFPAWSYAPGTPDRFAVSTYRVPRFLAVTGRLGFVPAAAWMLHLDAGLAEGKVYHEWADLDSLYEGEFGAGSASASGTVLGAGVAWSIDARWSFTLDYRRIELDRETFDYPGIDNYPLPTHFRVETEIDTLNAGLTYRF